MDNEPVMNDPVNTETPICSAKGCRASAVWVLAWNNPKLHTPERRKTWLACDDHREHLSGFLDLRGFLKDVVTLADWESRGPDGTQDGTRDGTRDSGDSGSASGDR
ncbi:hypothetical protein ACWF94_38320 [Streptomyces sp. NPDC055078]